MREPLVRLPAMVSDLSGEFIGTTPALPSGDRVELTDLEVIQRWSLAVRGASADRSEVLAALRADLAWLEGRRNANRPADEPTRTIRKAPAKKSATKKAASKTGDRSGARSSTARGGARRR